MKSIGINVVLAEDPEVVQGVQIGHPNRVVKWAWFIHSQKEGEELKNIKNNNFQNLSKSSKDSDMGPKSKLYYARPTFSRGLNPHPPVSVTLVRCDERQVHIGLHLGPDWAAHGSARLKFSDSLVGVQALFIGGVAQHRATCHMRSVAFATVGAIR